MSAKKNEEALPILDPFTCERCTLCKSSKTFVKPVGNLQGKILFLGDLPEIDDELTGVAFSGPRGVLLKKYMDKVGIATGEAYLTNTVMCKTPQNRAPKTVEVNACKSYIRWIIQNMPNLRYVVPMGVIALKACTNLKDLTHKRGSIIEKKGVKYLPMLSPISTLNNQTAEAILLQDLTLLKNLIEDKVEYGEYRVVTSLDIFNKVIAAINHHEVIAVDIETSNYKNDDFSTITNDEAIGISLSWKEKTGVYVPIVAEHKRLWEYDTEQYIIKTLGEALTAKGKKLVLHNGKFDTKFLLKAGIDLTTVNYNNNNREQVYFFDTMMAAFLLDEISPHGLDYLVKDYEDLVSYDNELENYKAYYAKTHKLGNTKLRDYSLIPLDIIGKYAAMDADATIRLYHKYYPQIYDNNFQDVYFNVVMPLMLVLTDVEMHGIKINVNKLQELKLLYEKRLNELQGELMSFEGLPPEFNLKSPKQLGVFLYDTLQLRPISKTEKDAYCCDEEALNKLKHPFVNKLKEYRKVDKDYTTYVLGYLKAKDEHDVLHPTFNPDGTETGRLCVSGDTELDTTMGRFDIASLDLTKYTECAILTHEGIKMPITSKFFKGREIMYKVTLGNGNSIKCTKGHQFLTPEGWRHLHELKEGSTVCTYDYTPTAAYFRTMEDTRGEQLQANISSRELNKKSGEEQIQHTSQCNLGDIKLLQKEIQNGTDGSKAQELQQCPKEEYSREAPTSNNYSKEAAGGYAYTWEKLAGDIKAFFSKRIFNQEKYTAPQPRNGGYAPNTDAESRSLLLRKNRENTTRYFRDFEESSQGSKEVLRDLISSIIGYIENTLVYKTPREGFSVLERYKQVREITCMLVGQPIRDALVFTSSGVEYTAHTPISSGEKYDGRFCISIPQISGRIGWRISSDEGDKEKRQAERGITPETGIHPATIYNSTCLEKSGGRCFSDKISAIKSVEPIGEQDIWDIEVAVHHSYCAQGFINHNSCKQPNVQNVPRGSHMRKLFVARPGYAYIIADFSQIELRVEAAVSQDPMLLQCFWDDLDVHEMVARQVLNKKPEESITKEERNIAKGINFGLIYGRQAYSLAQELKISEEAAQSFIDTYFAKFRGVTKYNEKQIDLARREKKVWTLFGRIRHLPDINSKIDKIRAGVERQAMNSPVQGTAADCTNKAAVSVFQGFIDRGIDAHIVNHVHDELVIETHIAQIEDAAKVIYNVMRYTAEEVLKIPVHVDISVNDQWYEPDPKKEPEDAARVKEFAAKLGFTEDFVSKLRSEYISPLPKREVKHVI